MPGNGGYCLDLGGFFRDACDWLLSRLALVRACVDEWREQSLVMSKMLGRRKCLFEVEDGLLRFPRTRDDFPIAVKLIGKGHERAL